MHTDHGSPFEGNSPPHSKKHRKPRTTWLAAEEAAIVAELLVQKLAGNTSESGFKPSVWQAVKNAVTASISGHGNKDVKQCKTRYQKVCCGREFG